MATKRRKTKKKPKKSNIKVYGILLLAFMSISSIYLFFWPNTNIRTDYCYFYVPSHSTTTSVYDSLTSQNLLNSGISFWIAQNILKFKSPKEGLYRFKKSWGNFQIVKDLKAGSDKPWTTVETPSYRSRQKTIKKICRQADVDDKVFIDLLEDNELINSLFSLDKESIFCIFLPGEHKVYKDQSEKELLYDMYVYYEQFWNEGRTKAARKIGCSPEDVVKLASIVYAETKNEAEMPMIAGIYLNRLRKNMLLQADPTLVYANNNQDAKRVYFKHIESSSPYNTYKFKGLPPGPIGPAPLVAIDAVLNSKEHNYLFFCAKEDQSGCHYFSEDFEEHKMYASRYRNMLNRKKIK